MLARTPEPELMDGPEQAEAYAVADFADVNQAFVDRFLATFPDAATGHFVDLGCGPADIPIRLARALPQIQITGVDGAEAMLAHGREAVRRANLGQRIALERRNLPSSTGARYDALISNSLLHHLGDPQVLWTELKTITKPGAPILIVDLMRPATAQACHDIVERYAANERPILKADFEASLHSAFTVAEVQDQLQRAGLVLAVEAISDRHLLVSGRMR